VIDSPHVPRADWIEAFDTRIPIAEFDFEETANMMELIVVVCLHVAPDRCEERSIGLYPEMSATTCVMQGQPQIAVWAETHPELKVTRWSCRDSAQRLTRA
jgi:hypothetical protein